MSSLFGPFNSLHILYKLYPANPTRLDKIIYPLSAISFLGFMGCFILQEYVVDHPSGLLDQVFMSTGILWIVTFASILARYAGQSSGQQGSGNQLLFVLKKVWLYIFLPSLIISIVLLTFAFVYWRRKGFI